MTASPKPNRSAGKRRVTLGVSAGIAIYKACDLVRRLMERGCEVRVVMTEHATRMVSPVTFQALSGNSVISGLFEDSGDPAIAHIELAKWEEIFVVAPATANILAKFARGIADDFLSTHYLANRSQVLIVPAMNGHMWRHPAVRENLAILEGRGHSFLLPASGLLACGDVDEGKLPDLSAIAGEVLAALAASGEMRGLRVLVTAGPTREPLDPVRFISNRSSGKMGYAVAAEALQRGAEVTLVSGPSSLQPPSGAQFVRVTTTSEMDAAVREHLPRCRFLVMAAAPADYAPSTPLGSKRKKGKGAWELALKKTPDILEGLKTLRKPSHVIAGFAAETENLIENARKKLRQKGLDLICANDVSKDGLGFDSDANALVLLWKDGAQEKAGPASKAECARLLWDALLKRFPPGRAARKDAPRTPQG